MVFQKTFSLGATVEPYLINQKRGNPTPMECRPRRGWCSMSAQAGWRLQSKPPLTDQSAAEIEVQDRLRDLDDLVDRISAANRDKVSISGETSVPDSLRDLRAIVKANHEEVLVA